MYNVIKLQAPFEKIIENNTCSEIRLARAIILQHVIDATNISSMRKLRKLELEAKEWIFTENEDFHTICNLALIEPFEVIKITRSLIYYKHKELIANKNVSYKLMKKLNYTLLDNLLN